MWGSDTNRADLTTASLAIIGGVITTIAIFSARQPDATTVSRGISAVIAACGGALIISAAWLHRTDHSAHATTHVLGWTIGATTGGFLLGAFVLLHQYSVGVALASPRLVLFRTAAAGALAGAVIGAYDARHQRHRREAARTQSVLEELVEAAPAPIVAFNHDGDVELWNGAAERLFGYETEEVLGTRYPIVPDDKIDEFDGHLGRVLDGGHIRGKETTRQRKDGSLVDVRVYARPMEDFSGGIWGAIAIIVDVSEEKRRRQQLAVLNRVLRHNLRNDMTVIVGHADDLIDRLTRLERTLTAHQPGDRSAHDELREATEVATDVQDDAAAALEALDEVMAALEEPPPTDLATGIKETARGLVEIGETARSVEQVIDQDTTYEELEIAALVERATRTVRQEHSEADITVEANGLDGATAEGPVQLKEAVAELVENAIVHQREGEPAVEVVASATEGWVRIEVRDNGPGIPEAERAVLEKGTESALRHGSGLGLWFVTWCVSVANGQIELSEAADGGTIVEIKVPKASTTVEAAS